MQRKRQRWNFKSDGLLLSSGKSQISCSHPQWWPFSADLLAPVKAVRPNLAAFVFQHRHSPMSSSLRAS
jgi:hypothetical protein